MSISHQDGPRQGRALALTRADLEMRLAETFLLLNEIASSQALIERCCGRALALRPVDTETALERELALRTARDTAHATLEQIGDLSDRLTAVLRFISHHKRRTREAPLAVASGRHSLD